MKKLLLSTIFTALMLLAFVQTNYAQDNWVQGKKGIYTVGVGGTQVIPVGGGFAGYGYGYGYGYGVRRISTIGVNINVGGEYKVWDWIGVGWQTGIMIFPYAGVVGIGIPIGAKANVHILDAANVSIADKLDVYAGLNFGGGPLIYTYGGGATVAGFIHVGPQVGVRYWFNDKVAIMGEFGWGATFANVGVTF